MTKATLTPEEKGSLANLATNSAFMEEDALMILESLQPKIPPKKSTVVYQDFNEFIYYLTADEWAVGGQTVDSAVRVFIQVLVQRLRCLHADEHTLKRLAATAVALTSIDNLASAPSIAGTVHKTVKEQYRKAQRKYKLYQKPTNGPMPDTPVVLVPPCQLDRMFPAYAASIKAVDDWCPPPQSVAPSRVFLVDSLLSCRGGGNTGQLATSMALTSPSNQMMNPGGLQMMQYMMHQFAERLGGKRREEECEILVGSGASHRKRSLKDFVEGGHEMDGHPPSWKRSSTLPAIDNGPQRQHQAASAANLDIRTDPPDELPDAPAAPVAPQPTAAAPAATSAPALPGSHTADAMPETKEGDPPLTRGQRLMQAYMDREKGKKTKSEQQATEKTSPKAGSKAAKANACHKGMAGKQEKKDPLLPTQKKNRKNRVEHEASRNQFLARGSDGSKQFKYGKGETYADAAKAKIAAQKWIKS